MKHSLPQPRRRDQRRPVLLAIGIGLVGGLLLAGPLSDLLKADVFKQGRELLNPFTAWMGASDQDLLVMGTDMGTNTDVMATVRIKDGVTKITQVPRDTYIESPKYGALKINALYSLGGPRAVQAELASHLGRPISHHILVDLALVRRLGDALGGLEVTVPKRMYYNDYSQKLFIDLQPGPQTLKGKDLEGFLRFRHDELGDIGRLERQKLAVQALFNKLTRPENIIRLPALMGLAGKDLKTDLGPMEIGGLITSMAGTHLEISQLPGVPTYRNGISYWDVTWPAPENPSDKDNNRYRFLF
jgi:LCP family protein required for cell wall assembly